MQEREHNKGEECQREKDVIMYGKWYFQRMFVIKRVEMMSMRTKYVRERNWLLSDSVNGEKDD